MTKLIAIILAGWCVTITALGYGSGTGNYGSIGTSLAGTNATVVNGVFPANTVNTNNIGVSGAGSNAVNQTYTWNGASAYTNPVNNIQMQKFGSFFWLTNSTLNIKYYRIGASALTTLLPLGFSTTGGGVGASPNPTGMLGTNAPTYTTNNSSITRSTLPINSPNGAFVFVSLGGNDATAVRGSTDFAYATMATAVTNMQPGDVMYLDSGTFYAANLNFPSQSACRGRGALLTTVTPNTNGTSSQDRSFLFTNQVNQGGLLADFTWATTNQASVGNLQSIASYVGPMEFRNLIIQGDSDGLNPISTDGPSSANLYDCKIYSAFDQIAMSAAVSQTVNLYNCDLNGNIGYRSSAAASFVRGIVSGLGPVTMIGGSITESNSASETTCVENTGGASIPVNLVGVALNVGSTNGGTVTFSFNSNPVNMMGCLTNGAGYLNTLGISAPAMSITTNTASLFTVTNPITSGGYWTNTTTADGFTTIDISASALTGNTAITNYGNGEWHRFSNIVGQFSVTMRVAPNDYVLVTNTTGADTVDASWFRP